jgi:hypothetical protein
MSIPNIFKQLKIELKVDIKKRAQEREFASGFEAGVRHPNSGAYALVRDDGVAELASGPGAAVTVDGSSSIVTAKGNAIALKARYLHLQTPPGGLYFGYQRFNPYWLSKGSVPDLNPASILLRSPLVFNSLTSVGFPLLTGLPQPGQSVVTLGSLLLPIPLFGPNEQLLIMARNLGELMKSLTL